MAGEDLVFAGVASALLRNAKPASTATPPTGPSPTVSFTAEQLDQLAGAVAEGVRSVQIPTPTVNFPADLQVRFSDSEIQRLASAIQPSAQPAKLVETRVLTLNADGTVVNGTFPLLTRLLSYQFTQSYQLIAVTLSCSIVNTQASVAGLFVGRDLGDFVDIGQQSDTQVASDIFISQLTHQNSTLVTIAPLSRTNTIAFSGDKQFIQVEGGTRLALYGCGANNAGNLFSAVVNLHLVAN